MSDADSIHCLAIGGVAGLLEKFRHKLVRDQFFVTVMVGVM